MIGPHRAAITEPFDSNLVVVLLALLAMFNAIRLSGMCRGLSQGEPKIIHMDNRMADKRSTRYRSQISDAPSVLLCHEPR